MRRLLSVFLAFLFMAGTALAAGTFDPSPIQHFGSLKCLTINWTSSSGGAFTDATTVKIDGVVIAVLTDPDATAAPTASYDITLKNSNGLDIMGGKLEDRSDTATEMEKPYNATSGYGSCPVDGPLTLAIASMGNSKAGVIKIYFFVSGGR